MEKLVLSKMHEHGEKLDRLHTDIGSLKVQIAILNDREDRELAAAKSIAVKWGTAVGALVSTIIGGLFAWFRPS
jgi:antitoxin component HigA of HigAB toxin-antitoxin module